MTYIVILTGLWITITIGFAMDFMLVRRGYVFHNSSPLDMASYFIIDNDPSTAVYMIVDRISYTLSMSIADGLMVTLGTPVAINPDSLTLHNSELAVLHPLGRKPVDHISTWIIIYCNKW